MLLAKEALPNQSTYEEKLAKEAESELEELTALLNMWAAANSNIGA